MLNIPSLNVFIILTVVYKIPNLIYASLEEQRCTADPSSCSITPWIYGVIFCTLGCIIFILIIAVALNQRAKSYKDPLKAEESVNDIPTNLIHMSTLEKEHKHKCEEGIVTVHQGNQEVVAHAVSQSKPIAVEEDTDDGLYEMLDELKPNYAFPKEVSHQKSTTGNTVASVYIEDEERISLPRSGHWDSTCGTLEILPEPHPGLFV